jgi:hypothetical protein
METPQSGVTPAAPQQAPAPVAAPAAGVNEASSPQAGPEPAQETPEVKVPLHVVTALRDELSSTKQGRAELESKLHQIESMQRLQQNFQPPPQAPQPAPAQPAPADPFTGMTDDELMTVQDVKKILNHFQSQQRPPDIDRIVAPLHKKLAELEVRAQDSNYEKTIRTYLPEMVTQNPMLQGIIANAPNQLAAALAIAKMSPRYIQETHPQSQPKQPEQRQDVLSDLQKIIENASRPSAPGAMGGGGAVSGNDRFAAMDDAALDAEVQRVLNGRVA